MPRGPQTAQGGCTTLGGLCILDAKQLGRIFYGSGPWVRLSLVNMRLVNGNSRDACERACRGAVQLLPWLCGCAWGRLPAAECMPCALCLMPFC